MIELNQFQTILAVANSGSFSRAAQDMSVTQSAVSQSIKNIEKKLGVSLFKRSGKSVILTTEGKLVLNFAQKYSKEVDELLDEVMNSKDKVKGKLVIGTLTGVGKSWLSRKVIEFSEKFPDVNIELKLAFYEELLELFDKNLIDGMVVPNINLGQNKDKVLIGEERLTLVYPDSPEFPITSKSPFEELVSYPIISYEENDTSFSRWCMAVYNKKVSKTRKRLIINAHGNILEAVSKGLGIAVLPSHVVSRSHFLDKVKVLGNEFSVKSQDFFFVYQKEQMNFLRMKLFIDSLVSSLENDPLH